MLINHWRNESCIYAVLASLLKTNESYIIRDLILDHCKRLKGLVSRTKDSDLNILT